MDFTGLFMALTGLQIVDSFSIFAQLQQIGLFEFILPGLLIFAIVYGLLDKAKILGENKGVNLIIALSIAILALQFGNVSLFFSQIFPRLGIGVAIMVTLLILIGIFVPMGMDEYGKNVGWGNYVFFGVGAVIFLVAVFDSLANYSLFNNLVLARYSGTIAVVIIIIIVIVLVMSLGKKSEKGK